MDKHQLNTQSVSNGSSSNPTELSQNPDTMDKHKQPNPESTSNNSDSSKPNQSSSESTQNPDIQNKSQLNPKSISTNKSSSNPQQSSTELSPNQGQKRKISGAMQRKLKRALLEEKFDPKTKELSPQDAAKVLQVVVCHQQQPTFFTVNQVSVFEASLNEAIKKASKPDLKFLPTQLRFKQILVTAANQSSRDWFLQNLNTIRPFGPDDALEARDPALFSLKKASLWVSDEKHPPTRDVLATLEKQNVPIACCKWRVLERKEQPMGLKFILKLDPSSVQRIRNKNLKMWYKDTLADVEILEENIISSSKTPGNKKSMDKGGKQDGPIIID